MFRAYDQIKARRRDLRPLTPAELSAVQVEAVTMPDLPPMPATLASFCDLLDNPTAAADASKFTIGKTPVPPPIAPKTTPKAPRHTP